MKKTLDKRQLLKSMFPAVLFALILFVLFAPVGRAQTAESEKEPEIIASGGQFTLEKAVTAGGGVKKENASISENGTTGQAVAGVRSTGGGFALSAGFWTPDDLVPTASNAIVAGRVLTATGQGIRQARVSITFPTGEIRTAVTGSFGYYSFAEIPVGQFYVVSVTARKFVFSQPTQIREVLDDVRDVDFLADERNLIQ